MIKKHEQKFTWHALYQNGDKISQFVDNKENNSINISRTGLIAFSITTIEGIPVVKQLLRPGQLLLYRTRNILNSSSEQIDKIHIVGVVENNVRSIMFIHEAIPDICVGDFNDIYFPIEYLEHDLVPIV